MSIESAAVFLLQFIPARANGQRGQREGSLTQIIYGSIIAAHTLVWLYSKSLNSMLRIPQQLGGLLLKRNFTVQLAATFNYFLLDYNWILNQKKTRFTIGKRTPAMLSA